jgi:hypothetical protein
MRALFAASDIVLLPSWREGLSRALIEAAAIRLLHENPDLARRFGQAARRKVIALFRVSLVNRNNLQQYAPARLTGLPRGCYAVSGEGSVCVGFCCSTFRAGSPSLPAP